MIQKNFICNFKGEIFGILSGLFWAINLILIDSATSLYKELSNDYLFLSIVLLLTTEFFSLIFLLLFRVKKITLDLSKNIYVLRQNTLFLILPSVGMGLYILSIIFSGISVTAYFTAIYPIFSLVILFFLYKKFNYRTVISIVLSVIGLYLTIESSPVDNYSILGIGLALLCAFSWGSESVCCEYFSIKSISPETLLFFRYIISIFICVVLFLTFFSFDRIFILESGYLLYLILVSIFSLLSYLFYYTSISIIGASYAIILNVSYILWVMFFLFMTYSFTVINIIGGFSVFCAIVISFLRGGK
ncbi:DMT family transporter [Gallibacterium trehalosifermentans]|uniref:DMT family transporter n=1 Tax=Gallibacterium trehalosifermentans TaxID=516935 RepID=A0ABV6H0F3_9PAST